MFGKIMTAALVIVLSVIAARKLREMAEASRVRARPVPTRRVPRAKPLRQDPATGVYHP